MSRTSGPFTNKTLVAGPLYGSADRLARRTSALHQARTSGPHAAQVIAGLAASAMTPPGTGARVADIGCGRGTTTRILTQRLPAASLAAVDLSAAMLAAARQRVPAGTAVAFVRADFHHLPLQHASCDIVVAAFCLYHSSAPGQVIADIGRCLRPGGTAILATKSADSYRELDELVAAAGLDPQAASRPSLYAAAHSGNLAALVSSHLQVRQVLHHAHRFTFASLAHAAQYLATSPKYAIPADLAGDPEALAAALRERFPDQPVCATSTVTYVAATSTAADGVTTNPATYVKRYGDSTARRRAERNYRWLAGLGAPLLLPPLLTAAPRCVSFEHVTGRHAEPGDLAPLARHLGAVHAVAHAAELRHARLDRPWHTPSGHQIPDFLGRRLAAVVRELRAATVPSPAFSEDQAVRLLRRACGEPAAFYKDANPRNFLITPVGPVTVDFDELTLAPFGYDLAKLVVTLAMTYGPLPAGQIADAMDAYNTAANQRSPGTGILTWAKLMSWADIHHILTHRYLSRAGYRYGWHAVRPRVTGGPPWQ